MDKLRYRQIHLDFHTSPMIPEIGARFDKEHWQKTLKDAHVDSITCFATGHHGWSYYKTEVGDMHPHLNFDLLREQFDACKEIDVNVPIYLTAGVNNLEAEKNPGWREINSDGRYVGWTASPIESGFKTMCFNTDYLDLLCKQIDEVVQLFPNCDGIFLDIISQGQCCCPRCIEDMQANNLDPRVEEDRIAWSKQVLLKYYKATTDAAKKYDSNMRIFHNSGHIQPGDTSILQYFSHLELESLPTGGWGYDHFPMSAKYVKKLEKWDIMGMTGKFHTTWGEFGGIKHPNALRYECAAMIAYGTKCSIGDQLHPCGKLDDTTYKVIGEAYREVAQKEPWCDDAVNVADIALLSVDAMSKDQKRNNPSDIGANRILLEGQFLYDILDAEMDFSDYKMLIIPNGIEIDSNLKAKIDSYLTAGGKLIIVGNSVVDENENLIFDIGAEYCGQSPYSPDFLQPVEGFMPSFGGTPFVNYVGTQRIRVTDGTTLGDVYDPYFNRAYNHFCSHQHTPFKPDASGFACGSTKGNILYLSNPIFILYSGYGAVIYKEYAINCINYLLGTDKTAEVSLPSTGRITLTEQSEEKRNILHLLYANTIGRGGEIQLDVGDMSIPNKNVELIDELIPLYNIEIKVNPTIDKVSKVTLEPQGEVCEYTQSATGEISLTLKKLECHQMIVIS